MKTLKHKMDKLLARGCVIINLNADRLAPESLYLFGLCCLRVIEVPPTCRAKMGTMTGNLNS